MKKIVFIAILVACGFIACDKVDETREITDVTTGEVLSENAIVIEGDTLTIVESAESAEKHVYFEEFTGHLCGTCPPAAIILDSLRSEFGEKLITVGIHSGQFADTCPSALDCPSAAPVGSFTTNYRSSPGDAWTTLFGVNSNPLAMINRIGYPSTHKKFSSTWRTNIVNELAVAPGAKINITAIYDAVNGKVKAAVKTELLNALNDSLILQIVLVEDSVVNWQQWYNHSPQYVQSYVHHDILRAAFNSNVGQPFRPDTLTKMLVGYSLPVLSTWNPSKCKVVAFLYNKATYTVIQAGEAKLD